MFTGIIEELGRIARFDRHDAGARAAIEAGIVTDGLASGDSVAINGVCLTAVDISPGGFAADISPETLARTTLGGLRDGSTVNLERAVTPASRLGGHIVQGHVDGRGTFLGAEQAGDFRTVRIGFPREMRRYFVYKGSVAVEGISLTIASIADEAFDIAVIPKTWDSTNLSSLEQGDEVNLEADIIAKYVENIMRFGQENQ